MDTRPLDIYLGRTRARIMCYNSHTAVPMLRKLLRSGAQEWEFDPRRRVNVPTARYYHYNSKKGELRIPRHMLGMVTDALDNSMWTYRLHDDTVFRGSSIGLSMTEGFQFRKDQERLAEFLAGDGQSGMRALPLQTGKGKTCVSIAAAVMIDKPVIVITSGLIEQWRDEFLSLTNIDEENIYILREFQSVGKLYASDYKPKVIVASLQTVMQFIKGEYKELFPSWQAFLKEYGITTKIVDEAHMNFQTITDIDLSSDVCCNLYLSATFTRNNPSSKRIFSMIFPNEIQCDVGRYHRYVKVCMYNYQSGTGERRVTRQRGYMQAKYEAEFFKRKTKFNWYMRVVVLPLVYSHFYNIKTPGERVAIYVRTTKMVESLAESLTVEFPDLKVITYSGNDLRSKYEDPDVDIIITTDKKAGVGTDIRNLRSVINLISSSAESWVIQMLGRLRELKSGRDPEYADICDQSIGAHVRHRRTRRRILQAKAKELHEFQL